MQCRTKVRRRVLACARCRKRKLSCDGKIPSCSRCVDAGVPCVGFDSSTQREAPRSIAQFLEMHIARLEDPAATQLTRPSRPNAAFPSLAASHEPDAFWAVSHRCAHADSLVNHVMEDMTPSFLGISKAVPIVRCVVKGTRIPSAKRFSGATDLDENHPRSIINPQPATMSLESIKRHTRQVDQIFDNYLDRVITQYPIYHKNDVIAAFRSIYHPSHPGQDTPRDRYMISIIMAISFSTAARTNQEGMNRIASDLVKDAMQYLPVVATNDLPGLQAILLLTQYIFLNPSMANLWLLTGLISQACIDLGLHQELPNDARVSAYERDMRRRLFWCAWEMEVAVCAIFLRPINLPTRFINVAFPVEVDDTAISEAGIDRTGRVSKFTSRRIWLFRKIEADIMSVLYQNEPIPKDCCSLEQWMQGIEASIIEWHREVFRAGAANTDPAFEARWQEMLLYANIAYPYILVILFRPSPRIKEPSKENLLKAFIASVRVADGYWQQSNADFGRIKYVFHPCHHTFASARVFLQALQRCTAEISDIYSPEQVEEWMGCFSRFFSTIAERWPAATRCLEEYERLLAPVKKNYAEFLAQKVNNAFQPTVPLGDMIVDPLTYSTNLEEPFNLWTVFNPATTVDASDTLGAYAYVPHDWDAEFNFGMDAIPGF
ncbi:GAL4-like transcription factor-like protein [Zopfia rhizophila CBS 207.26]|uniref:GAL4-like transcription factor-like protein n=1 Tax=Zopfia rhizophila CBS 207.26 TaxID=1314779 RepID=A0A6A6EBH9_9PEZI|nr:GAL4-like transcription factor-like protein [Zopfia rhizophila CBS 207.26]